MFCKRVWIGNICLESRLWFLCTWQNSALSFHSYQVPELWVWWKTTHKSPLPHYISAIVPPISWPTCWSHDWLIAPGRWGFATLTLFTHKRCPCSPAWELPMWGGVVRCMVMGDVGWWWAVMYGEAWWGMVRDDEGWWWMVSRMDWF